MDTEDDLATRLCTGCGLCCSGVVLSGVLLKREPEVRWAKRKGLPLVQTPLGPAFAQPCPLLLGTRCGDYEERPAPCRSFRCRTLRLAEQGKIDLATAAAQLLKIREAAAALLAGQNDSERAATLGHAALVSDRSTAETERAASEVFLGSRLDAVRALRNLIDRFIVTPEENASRHV